MYETYQINQCSNPTFVIFSNLKYSNIYFFFNLMWISFKDLLCVSFSSGFFSFILTEIYFMDVYSYKMM